MEEKRMIDVDELRQELGFAENCNNCKRDARMCQHDSYFSMMTFCTILDDAIERILERHKGGQQA